MRALLGCDLVWSGSIGACHKITPLAGARASVRHASPAIRFSDVINRSPMAMRYPLSAHHPLRNAGPTLSADKEHAIRYYACTDCSESAECYRLQKGAPRHLNLPGGSHLRDTGKAPHGLFESLKSEEAQNRGQKSTSPAKRPRFVHLRQVELDELPVGTYKLSLYLENWLPVTSLLARKNSLIDIPGNSSLKALKFLQHCAAVFMKLAGFPPISLFFPDLQGISRPETRSRGTACTATQ
jgi:hypothetical protein